MHNSANDDWIDEAVQVLREDLWNVLQVVNKYLLDFTLTTEFAAKEQNELLLQLRRQI